MSLPLYFISWNCRGGLFNSRKQKFIRQMVSTHDLLFIGLVESKREIVDNFLINNLWPNLDFGFDWIPSTGASGGLVFIWNSILIRNVTITKGSRWIAFDFVFDNIRYRHILVYASNVTSERLLLWQELSHLMGFIGTIFISGDFNETLSPEDRWNSTVFSPSIEGFLLGKIHSRSHHEEFSNFVTESWGLVCLNSQNLIRRLRELRQAIKKWNSEVFGDHNKRIKELNQEILVKEIAAESGLLTEAEKDDLSKLKSDLWTAEKRVDSLWVQKSREKWNVEGDRNTKFFHSVASTHYRNNHISSIQVEDNIFIEPKDIRFHIRDFFSSLFSKSDRVVYDLSGLNFSKITGPQADLLTRPFMESEIFGALCSCGEKRRQGLMGSTSIFIGELGLL
ncbi:uncharacterized protein LOC126661575 [Mercurialis annua]|uniref:uncharacterized protein LOC126661575 n=1 Tax=Mercurialis annua TaxID=3986 RepID=UPI00215E0E41|nr:uncharacterized protein LOC126661575 [Mercurialis annua]